MILVQRKKKLALWSLLKVKPVQMALFTVPMKQDIWKSPRKSLAFRRETVAQVLKLAVILNYDFCVNISGYTNLVFIVAYNQNHIHCNYYC